MKLIFSMFLFLIISSAFSKDCTILWDKAYFQNTIATKQYNPKTFKREKIFLKFTEFKLYLPKKVTLNLPIKGDCPQFKVTEVGVYRKLGPHSFVGEEDDHSKHGLDPIDLKYEDSPFEVVTPSIEKKEGEIILKEFKVYEAIDKVPKGKRTWYMKFSVSYKKKDGISNKKDVLVKLPLTH
ncbi:MAG: hypothetical protein NXH75_01845 [Halobacteriovoraceae bacterium]|nr:hypothetical protein [Halobacteriovoraceae bacterium]